MKRRLGWMMAVAATAFVGACDKKAEVPAEPLQVVAPVAKPAETMPVAAKPEGTQVAAAAEPGGCGEHMKEAGGDENCPFHDEKEAGMGGCGDHMAAAPGKTDAGKHFGGAFALGEAKPLGTVLTGATDGQELNVRVSGQIEKVCQKMGCWMVVKDGPVEARVIMKDHAFTVPIDSQGKPTQVEGLLKVRIFTEAQAKHLAEDGGEDPKKVEGDKKEYILTATAVEIGG